MREPVRSHLIDVRRGRSNLADVLAECTELELRLSTLLESSPLPEPETNQVESFVMDAYAGVGCPGTVAGRPRHRAGTRHVARRLDGCGELMSRRVPI
jgi:hypothetical protein